MPRPRKTAQIKAIDQKRRSQLEYFSKAAAAIAGMSLIPTLATSAVSFKKGSTGSSTLWLADNGNVGINAVPTSGAGVDSAKLLINSDQGTASNSALRAIYSGATTILGEVALLSHRSSMWNQLYLSGTGSSTTNSILVEGTKPVIINGPSVGVGTVSPTTNLSIAKAVSSTETQMTAVSANAISIEATYVADNYLPGLVWYTTNNSPTFPKMGVWGKETSSGTYLYLGTSNNYAGGITNHVTIDYTGALTATKVYGAVWNDIADYLETDNEVVVEFGKVYVRDVNGKTRLSKKRCEKGVIGIASDTYGMSVGKKDKGKKEIPIALAGIVLAYVDKAYLSGTELTCTKAGRLTKMFWWEKVFCPGRFVATYYKPEKGKSWNGIVVKGRHWVKVKA